MFPSLWAPALIGTGFTHRVLNSAAHVVLPVADVQSDSYMSSPAALAAQETAASLAGRSGSGRTTQCRKANFPSQMLEVCFLGAWVTSGRPLHSLTRPGSLYTQSQHSHWRNYVNPESWTTFSKLRSFTMLQRSCDRSCWLRYDWCSTGVFILHGCPPLIKQKCYPLPLAKYCKKIRHEN